MNWKLEITKVDNGYIVEGVPDGGTVKMKTVIEEPSGESSELVAMQNLLLFVKEYFAVYHSKHNEMNLYVDIR